MIYLLLFLEFAKIGSFAVGGGLVTIPFLFDLADNYDWFTSKELVNMIAVSESTPGPIGINMATYVGFKTAGWVGSLVATFSLLLPSLIFVSFLAKLLAKYRHSSFFLNIMYSIRPAVLGLILCAGFELTKIAFADLKNISICVAFWIAIRTFKLNPISYIILGAIFGVYFKL